MPSRHRPALAAFLRKCSGRQAAYTLLELSLVLAVLSLLIGGILSVVTQNTRRTTAMEVKRKMDVIEAELINFRRLNGRLPCPGDSTQIITSQYFGIEGGSPGACNGTPTATFWDNSYTMGGDIPIKTLGLPDDYMFDPWGGRFFYAVDIRMTAASAFTTYAASSASIGSIIVTDGGGHNKTPPVSGGAGGAIAILMSYGPDGHGAYQLSGVRKNAGNSNPNTLINCYCTNAGVYNGAFSTTFVQAPATATSPTDPNSFDDILRFYLRSSFLNSVDVTLSR